MLKLKNTIHKKRLKRKAVRKHYRQVQRESISNFATGTTWEEVKKNIRQRVKRTEQRRRIASNFVKKKNAKKVQD